jgi:hypothetical protein
MNVQPSTNIMPNVALPEAVKNAGESLGNSINTMKSSVNESVNGFSQQAQAGLGASTQFLQSNTIVAKFAFIILIIIVFVLLLALGIMLIEYFSSPSANPYLISGMISGADGKIIHQDPTQADAIPIYRSNNQSTGLEFTWSVWLYINDLGNIGNGYQHIFNKGDTKYNSSNVSSINNGPGLYLGNGGSAKLQQNNLHIIMDTNDPNNSVVLDIDNIPLKKWVHVAIRAQNTILDVYVNGVISGRTVMANVPKQNYNDVNVCQNGGFSGNLSNLRYYGYALNVFEINGIVAYGPNTSSSSLSSSSANGNYGYLSNNWYATKL